MGIPRFDKRGNLPPGIHWATWAEFTEEFGTNGRRQLLISGLKDVLDLLQAAGCQMVYIDGSLVTNKEYPNDFDGCWIMDGVNPIGLDPVLFEFKNGCAAQKAKYFGEMHPIRASGNVGYTHLDLFQLDKNRLGEKKGIIALDLTKPL